VGHELGEQDGDVDPAAEELVQFAEQCGEVADGVNGIGDGGFGFFWRFEVFGPLSA
jgi:hypothetical protein